jgi:hypothetical protein
MKHDSMTTLFPDLIEAPIAPSSAQDPFQALDDLMQVIEALCPVWPPRDPFADSDIFIL